MNTITAKCNETAGTHEGSRRKLSVARRLGLGLAMALALLCAGVAVTATPASAAATGNVAFCLRYTNNSPYASKPVYLYYAAPGATSWTKFKSGTTNSAGCATWKSLPTGYSYLTQGNWTFWMSGMAAAYTYDGYTGAAYLSSVGGTVNQATGWVYLSRLY